MSVNRPEQVPQEMAPVGLQTIAQRKAHQAVLARDIQEGLVVDKFLAAEPQIDTRAKEALDSASQAGKDAQHRLFTEHDYVARSIARDLMVFNSPVIDRDDLVQVGRMGLLRAVRRFRPDGTALFATYATPTITNAIKTEIKEQREPGFRFPRAYGNSRILYKILRATLYQELERAPTPEEIADAAGKYADDMIELATEGFEAITPTASSGSISSFQTAPGQYRKREPRLRSLDELPDPAPGPEDVAVDRVAYSDVLARLLQIGFTHPHAREVVTRSSSEPLSDIAPDLGLTPNAISLIKAEAVDQMGAVATAAGLLSPVSVPGDKTLDVMAQETLTRQAEEALAKEAADWAKNYRWSSRLGQVDIAELTPEERWQLRVMARVEAEAAKPSSLLDGPEVVKFGIQKRLLKEALQARIRAEEARRVRPIPIRPIRSRRPEAH